MGIKKFIKNAIGVLIARYVIGSGKEGWLVTRKNGTQWVIKVYSRQAYENNILPRIYGVKEDNWIPCSERLPEQRSERGSSQED